MLFAQVVGQEAAKQGLLGMLRSNHLPHALLLVGPEGCGGLPLALALARYIFCENPSDDDACGVCAGCRKAERLEHADLHISFPSIAPKPGAKAMSRHFIQEFREFVAQTPYGTTFEWLQFINAENKQGNITAEECREIIDTLNLKSYEGGKKIQIIWRPEYLGKEGNILLKLIEEPPADTLLILVAERTEDILPTIRSRTQLVRLPPLPAADIAAALVARGLADERKAIQIGHLANGSFTEALRVLQHAGHDLFPHVRNWFNGLFTNNGITLTQFVEEWSKAGREQQKHFLQYVIQLLEQALRTSYLPQVPPPLPPEEAQFVQRLASLGLSHEKLERMVARISDTIFYIERNAHSKTQLLALSIRLTHIIQGKPELTADHL
jgi:DNA polymerase-3 subunit delta'